MAAVMCPIPVLFYLYGAKIRERSRFAPTMPPMGTSAGKQRDEENPVNNEAENPNGAPSKQE